VGTNDHEGRKWSWPVAVRELWLGKVGNVDELLEAGREVAPGARLNVLTPFKRREPHSPANAICHAQADGQGS
jgi:hypothetical protein